LFAPFERIVNIPYHWQSKHDQYIDVAVYFEVLLVLVNTHRYVHRVLVLLVCVVVPLHYGIEIRGFKEFLPKCPIDSFNQIPLSQCLINPSYQTGPSRCPWMIQQARSLAATAVAVAALLHFLLECLVLMKPQKAVRIVECLFGSVLLDQGTKKAPGGGQPIDAQCPETVAIAIAIAIVLVLVVVLVVPLLTPAQLARSQNGIGHVYQFLSLVGLAADKDLPPRTRSCRQRGIEIPCCQQYGTAGLCDS